MYIKLVIQLFQDPLIVHLFVLVLSMAIDIISSYELVENVMFCNTNKNHQHRINK